MRVLLDTNVLISAIRFGGIPRKLLVNALHGRLTLITSRMLLDELEELLRRKFRFSVAAAAETRRDFEMLSDVVEPHDVPNVSRDPDDNHVLAAAVTGGADAIVTGDQDLLEIGTYESVSILRPAVFIQRLSS